MLFQKLPIDGTFRWRDKNWLKITSSHAVSPDDHEVTPTFVPNCENVEALSDQPSAISEDERPATERETDTEE